MFLDVPADPTATRLFRRRTGDPVFPTRPGYHDSDQVIPTATRLTRRHHYQHNDILAVRRFSHRDRVPDTRTESWLCSGRAGSVPAVPAVSRSYDCVPDTLADTWLCRQYPGVCPLSVTHRLLFPVETKISAGPLLQSFTPRSSRCYQSMVTGTNCNELRVIWPVPHEILSVITRSTIIT